MVKKKGEVMHCLMAGKIHWRNIRLRVEIELHTLNENFDSFDFYYFQSLNINV